MTLEWLWYEGSPVLYLLSGGLASRYDDDSILLNFSGLLLAMTALTIIGLRLVSRQRVGSVVRRVDDR